MTSLTRVLRDRRTYRRLARLRGTAIHRTQLQSIGFTFHADTARFEAGMAKLQRTLAEVERRRAERASVARFHLRIAFERQIGRDFVQAYARRARADLGLEDR